MILIEDANKYERYCSCCASYRKPNFDELKFLRVYFAISDDSNRIVLTFCEECAAEMIELFQQKLEQ